MRARTASSCRCPHVLPAQAAGGSKIGTSSPQQRGGLPPSRELKAEIRREVGEYIFDIRNFRTDDTQYILDEAYKMTEMKFKTADYLLKNKPWDFFMMVKMSPDRLNHGIWGYVDPDPRYRPDNPYKESLRDYRFLDGKISDASSSRMRTRRCSWSPTTERRRWSAGSASTVARQRGLSQVRRRDAGPG